MKRQRLEDAPRAGALSLILGSQTRRFQYSFLFPLFLIFSPFFYRSILPRSAFFLFCFFVFVSRRSIKTGLFHRAIRRIYIRLCVFPPSLFALLPPSYCFLDAWDGRRDRRLHLLSLILFYFSLFCRCFSSVGKHER